MAAIPGQVLQKLSDKLLSYFGNLGDDLYQRDTNLRELQDHVKRLTPIIAQLLQIRDNSQDPGARECIQRISKEYEQVDRLRQPIGGIIQLVQTSGLIKEVNKNLSKLLADAKAVQQAFLSTLQTQEEHWKKGWDTSKPNITWGGGAVVNDLIDALTCRRYPWVVMFGMGGVGKTHMAREAYHNERVRKHFSGGVTQGMYWVTVSKDKPSNCFILQELCKQVLGVKRLPEFPRDLKDAVKKVKDTLHQKTDVLIVLDDVWDFDIVKCFDEILEDQQGVILVTTRDQGSVRCVADIAKFVGVTKLSEEESWKLFSWYAFRKKKNEDPELEGVAREVAKECDGLPLALRVIGATMRDIQLLPDEVRRGKTLQSEWEKILEKLQSAAFYEDKYKELCCKLQLSIDSLLAEDPRLFNCFCYFAAFPEDKRISAKELEDMWVAESLVVREDGSWKTRSGDAKLLPDALVHKSMIERTGDHYHIHDILRDLAHQNLAWDFLSEKEIPAVKRECLYAPSLMSREFPSEWTAGSSSWEIFVEWIIPRTSSTLRVERLSLYASRVSNLPSKFNAPHLRVLLLCLNEDLRVLHQGFFGYLSSLTVLDLSATGVEEISTEVLRSLKKLRILNLSFCEHLRTVSNEVNKLKSLEQLHLRFCEKLEYLPRVGSLQNLNSLSAPVSKRFDLVFSHGSSGWQRCSDYLNFRGLSRYAILELLLTHSLKLQHLQLTGDTVEDDKGEIKEANINVYTLDVSAFAALEELRISCLHPPAGIIKLRNLDSLYLLCTQLDLDYQIPALDEMPLLRCLVLYLTGSTEFPTSFGSPHAFPALETIVLVSSKVTHMFEFQKGTMPKIKTIRLTLEKLEIFPKSFRNLHTVNSFNANRCSEGVLRDVIELVKEEGCFVRLEMLKIFAEKGNSSKNLDTFGDLSLDSLPFLRIFESNCPREHLPLHVVDLEKQRSLQIVFRELEY